MNLNWICVQWVPFDCCNCPPIRSSFDHVSRDWLASFNRTVWGQRWAQMFVKHVEWYNMRQQHLATCNKVTRYQSCIIRLVCKALPTASNILQSFYSIGGSANRKKLSIAKPSRVFITSGFIASLKSIEQPQSVGFGFFLFISSPNVDPLCFCCHDISLQSKGQHGVKRDPGIWPDYWGIGASRKFYWELSFFFKTKHRFKLGFDAKPKRSYICNGEDCHMSGLLLF